jgi:uncharacterized protein YjiS (DUF1127 family)
MDEGHSASPSASKGTEMYLSSLIRGFAAWRRYRAAVQQLASMDDRALHDIGLDRTQIHRAAFYGR